VKNEKKPLGYMFISYMKGISEKFKCIGKHYNIRTLFKTKCTLKCSHVKTRPEMNPQQKPFCTYRIPCICGASYIDESSKFLALWLQEHGYNLRQLLPQKSRVVQYAYEEGHMVG
jgi:hypothetical protein